MVLLKFKCSPDRRKAVVNVSTTTSSPTLSLSAAEGFSPTFQIVITLSIGETSQPGRAITICTYGSVFNPSSPDDGLDTLALGTIGDVHSSVDTEKRISLGNLKPHFAHGADVKSPDLKQREWLRFITIPAEGHVQITHNMPIDRMFKYEDRLTKNDLQPGETYRFHLNSGYVGSSWWCWGDLDTDLKDKKLSAWQEGINIDKAEKPDEETIVKENWILGGNPAELVFEDIMRYAEFRIVE
ncbi:MAG: hypothetical protein LQ342_005361 [Letrouitia transgressa]|nr:MAG: hypothetical protein LQ342_005361 [Letrouitia transgressa]